MGVAGACVRSRSADNRSWIGHDGGVYATSLQPMSEEQLKSFWEAIESDTELLEKLRAAGQDPEAIAAIAQSAGFEISADEIREAAAKLSDESLSEANGGTCGCACHEKINQCW
jgi:predicted ribosomally synthesized peptide with nif11-like leader